MIIIGLFLCAISLVVIRKKLSFILKGDIVKGQIFGLEAGARSKNGVQGYRYKIRFHYDGEICVATSIESVFNIGGYPRPVNQPCQIYVKRDNLSEVSIKGNSMIIWIGTVMFCFGIVVMLL